MTTIEFHFDFGSPNAYLSHLVLPDIERRTGTRFTYVPVLLGGVFKATNNVSPMVSLQGIQNKAEYMALETERFLRRHAITAYEMNPHFPVNTLTIMRGAIAAEREGVFDPYIITVFHNMWADPKKMDDPEIIQSALEGAGLDGKRLLELTADPEIKAQLIANTSASVERGTFGSPTFFVGDEIFFGKDSLRDVEEEIIRVTAG
jgi:2-hydroxychromene-2-carboxylate isomerase